MNSLILTLALSTRSTQQESVKIAPLFYSVLHFDKLCQKERDYRLLTCTETGKRVTIIKKLLAEKGVPIDPPLGYELSSVVERYTDSNTILSVVFFDGVEPYGSNRNMPIVGGYFQPARKGEQYLVYLCRWDGRSGAGLPSLPKDYDYAFDISRARISSSGLFVSNLRMPWFRKEIPKTPKDIMLNLLDGCLRSEESAQECLEVMQSITNSSGDEWLHEKFPNLAVEAKVRTQNIFLRVSLAKLAYSFGGSKYMDQYLRDLSSLEMARAWSSPKNGIRDWMVSRLKLSNDFIGPNHFSEWSVVDPVGYAKGVRNLVGRGEHFGRMLDLASKTKDQKALELYASIGIHSKEDSTLLDVCLALFNMTGNPNLRDSQERPNINRLRQALKDIYPNAEKLPPAIR
jgi:hypothetical protein